MEHPNDAGKDGYGMKKSFILMLFVIFLAVLGCAPKMETEKIPMPQSKNRGSLRINLRTANDMEIEPADISRMKKLLKEKFT